MAGKRNHKLFRDSPGIFWTCLFFFPRGVHVLPTTFPSFFVYARVCQIAFGMPFFQGLPKNEFALPFFGSAVLRSDVYTTLRNEVGFLSKQGKLLFTQRDGRYLSTQGLTQKWNIQNCCNKGSPSQKKLYLQFSAQFKEKVWKKSCTLQSPRGTEVELSRSCAGHTWERSTFWSPYRQRKLTGRMRC